MWIVPYGEREIIPKRNGLGVMVLAFQSIEAGFGIEISNAIVKLINKKHDGKHYFDKVSAQDIHNTSEKAPLTKSSFVCF